MDITINICKTHGQNCDGRCVDPNVDNGMMTKVWGRTGWLFLHCITFGYPYTINPSNPDHAYKKQNYKSFFVNIGTILPCKYCRASYINFAKELPIDNFLHSRKDLCKWLYLIHNKVNNKLGADKNIPTFEETQKFYEQFRAKCKKTIIKERTINEEKGCVNPADGTPKKCLVKVINCKGGDITRRENSVVYAENATSTASFFSDYNIDTLFDYKNWIIPIIILLFINFIILKTVNKKRLLKYL